jgi:phage antirepressor YoqD-like protein
MPGRTYTVQEAAAELDIGSGRLYRWLRVQRVIDAGNRPYTHFRDRGLFTVRYGKWHHPYTGDHQYARPIVTETGLAWLRARLQEVPA